MVTAPMRPVRSRPKPHRLRTKGQPQAFEPRPTNVRQEYPFWYPRRERTGFWHLRRRSHGVLSTEVLERPADDGESGQERADDGQPPAQGQTEEDDRTGGGNGQRPPAVGAEEAVLSLGRRDQRRRVVLGPGVQLAAGLPEVETDQGRHARAQE